jgi:hypothetical protein
MITCLEFRRRAGSEPFASDDGMESHRRGCAACARYQDELRAMDGVIRRALEIDASPRAAAAPMAPGARSTRAFAIAASLVAGIVVGIVLLVSLPRAAIAREIAGHIAHEPAAMRSTVPLAPVEVEQVLGPEGTRLRPGIGDVTYAMRCVFDGHVVPHLVVRTPEGPVTVLVLGHREVGKPLQLREDGLEGIVLPAPRGSIAVIGEGIADINAVARRVVGAVDWDG